MAGSRSSRRLSIEPLERRTLLAAVLAGGGVKYYENAEPVVLAPWARLGELSPGSAVDLAVNIAQGAHGTDRLSLTPSQRVNIVGLGVYFDNVRIGGLRTGTGFLNVSFYDNATRESMQAVLRCVSYEAMGETPKSTLRTVVFELREARPAETFIYSGWQELTVRKPEGWQLEDRRPAIVLFHGGGWTGGGLGQFKHQASYYASIGMVAIEATYRKSPAGSTTPPWEAIQDVKSAIRWVREHADELGIDSNRIAAGGGSAGGHLAATAGMIEGYDNPADNLVVSSRPNALVLFSAIVDTGPSGHGYKLFGSDYEALSPTYNISSDDPPVLSFHGGADQLMKTAVVDQFHAKLGDAGVPATFYEYPQAGHTFFNFAETNSGYFVSTLRRSGAFLEQLGWLSNLSRLDVPEAYAFQTGGFAAIETNYKNVGVYPVNDAPTLTFSGQTTYQLRRPALTIVPYAHVSDVDSPYFSGGTLQVSIASGVTGGDLLAIGAAFLIDADHRVRYAGANIGMINDGGGRSGSPLVVTFNRNATPAIVQDLVRAITFKAVAGAARQREILISISDNRGASAELTKLVNVI